MDGAHTMARCAEVTEAVLHEVFHALHRHAVVLEHMLLKPSMVLPGKACGRAAAAEVAMHTVQVLKRTVPAAVPGVFLPVRRPDATRSHRQSRCDEPARPAAVAAVFSLRGAPCRNRRCWRGAARPATRRSHNGPCCNAPA